LIAGSVIFAPVHLFAQPRGGPGPQRNDESFNSDMTVIHALLDRGDDIRRSVEKLPNGVQTITESDDPALAMLIRGHVAAMHQRLEEQRPIHLRDPLFRALFGQAKKITMEIKPTAKGVEVRETSEDPWTVQLIQAHAAVVSAFIENGHREVRKNHPVPAPKP
jgi:hypothetical protein